MAATKDGPIMSAALHSLMREYPRSAPARPRGGLIPFIGVGGAGALLFVLLSSGMIGLRTGLADWLVSTLTYGALIVPVYLMHHRYSFRSQAGHGQALPRYLAVQGVVLALAAVLSYGALEIFALPGLVASVLVVGLVSGINYGVLRGWAFARRSLAPLGAG